jgi:methyl-accepting chemotaxis protein
LVATAAAAILIASLMVQSNILRDQIYHERESEIEAVIDSAVYLTNSFADRVEKGELSEHGKGFAVVASEVRKLAERSQAAATEINALSSDTVATADQAGRMLAQLVPAIQQTAQLVEEISAACREQNSGADEVNLAIQQLDTVIQQNSAASEEMSATAEEMSAQAQTLESTIRYFRVEKRAIPVQA